MSQVNGGVSRTVAVTNKRGLHARASAKFVNLASEIDAEVEVEKDGSRVVGTSIMGLMMLGAAMGDSITISAEDRLLQLNIDKAELERRRAAWSAPPIKYKTGVLAKYAKLVHSASQGAYCG